MQTLSRVHAILDIEDHSSMTIHDNHSLNKTFRDRLQLKPDVHYALDGGEVITLGEVKLKFEIIKEERIDEESNKEEKVHENMEAKSEKEQLNGN